MASSQLGMLPPTTPGLDATWAATVEVSGHVRTPLGCQKLQARLRGHLVLFSPEAPSRLADGASAVSWAATISSTETGSLGSEECGMDPMRQEAETSPFPTSAILPRAKLTTPTSGRSKLSQVVLDSSLPERRCSMA